MPCSSSTCSWLRIGAEPLGPSCPWCWWEPWGVTVWRGPGEGDGGQSHPSCARTGFWIRVSGQVRVPTSGSRELSPDTSACSGPTWTPALGSPPTLRPPATGGPCHCPSSLAPTLLFINVLPYISFRLTGHHGVTLLLTPISNSKPASSCFNSLRKLSWPVYQKP